MKTETITTKINDKSDAELRDRLSKKFYEIRREFTDGCSKSITVKGGYIKDKSNGDNEYIVDAHAALKKLEELSFETQFERNRDKAVSEFMDKVERLGSEIDNIRSQVG